MCSSVIYISCSFANLRATFTPLVFSPFKPSNAYWRAANYLSAGQLNLLDNPFPKNYNQI
ncbi:hypothetical protein GPL00_08095 [Dorea formicigenerans]|nr:hypothetical protein [Dorea formicigenerans]